jgi:hypothetical protein
METDPATGRPTVESFANLIYNEYNINEEAFRAWIEGLRSGEYEQTRGSLRLGHGNKYNKPEGYCCLGVACDTTVKKNATTLEWVDLNDDKEFEDSYKQYRFGGNQVAPPDEVSQWFFGTSRGPYIWRVVYEGEVHSLADLNDIDKLTFEQIADLLHETYIERKWEQKS